MKKSASLFVATLALFGLGVSPALTKDVVPPKGATATTQKAHQHVHDTLPFHDTQDFKDATRGFIAADDPVTILTKDGKTAWDLESYKAFIKQNTKAPDTVNPSLWRQAQLNMLHGLFKVSDRIYQVRGYDLSNITFIQGDTGWIVIDPLISTETAKAALDLVNKHVGKRPVVAVIYSHPHVDHYGGIHGVVDIKDVQAGKIPIYAPQGFLEHAVSENVIAGAAMGRRAQYMYGAYLPRDAKGSVGSGLGITTSLGNTGLIPPTQEITHTGEKLVVDGVEMIFQMTPGTEAPAEMNTWFPQFKALWMAENSCATMHNILTLRGAQVRDALVWSKYINEAIELWADQATVRFQSHHWPMWETPNIVKALEKQRDLYKYMHDQSVNLMNKGYTASEISEMLHLPDSLGHTWANRGYYGTLQHNSRAIYQRYLGWYSGHPSDLNNLPPQEAAQKYVEYMGGEKAILDKAKASFTKGDYRWVAEVLKHVVFANEKNTEARHLLADAFEQMGYQAESGPWRNVYLQGAFELRNGIPKPTMSTANKDTVKQMPLELTFDYMGVRLNAQKAKDKNIVINFAIKDTDKTYTLFLGNSVLNYSTKSKKTPQLTVSLPAQALTALLYSKDPATVLKELKDKGLATSQGKEESLWELLGMLDVFGGYFPIVTP